MKPNIIYSFPIQNQFILSIVSALRVAFRATLAVLVLGCITSVSSAQTWTGNTSANWDTTTSGNWNGGIPSAADAGDYVYFNAPPASGNGTTTPINLSVGYSPGDLNVIYFYGTAYTGSTGYTIDASNSGNLGVSVIDLAPSFDGSGITETVNAPITAGAGGQNGGNVYLENYAPLTANSAYPIAFGGTGYNDTLAIGGSVTFTDTSSNSSYTLNLLGTGNGSISGNITQNLAGGVVSLAFDSSGTWTLSGNNYMEGTTTFTGGGTLAVSYANGSTTGLTENGFTFGSASFAGGATLSLSGNTSGIDDSETPASIVIDPGASRIDITSTNSQTELYDQGTWSPSDRAVGATMDFNLVQGTGGADVVLPSAANTNGIFGGWATYGGGATWAVVTNSGLSNAEIESGLTTFTDDTWGGTTNTDVITDGTIIAAGATTNSLRFNSPTALNLTLGGTSAATGDTITSGGILITPTVGANTVTISGGVLEPGSGNELILNQYDTSGTLDITSSIDLPSNGALTISGGGTVILGGANAFAGSDTVYINQGTVDAGNNGAFGTFSAAANVVLAGNSILNLDGYSITIGSISDNSNNSYNGTLLAQSGLTDAITNTAAGTISTLTIVGNSYFTGGTTEAPGAILSLNIDAYETFGSAYPFVLGVSQNTYYDLITGGINVGTGGTLRPYVYQEYYYYSMLSLGVFDTTSPSSIAAQGYNEAGYVGSTYLTGSSTSALTGGGAHLILNLIGSASDPYTGSFSGAILHLAGTGTLSLSQGISGAETYLSGTTTLITPSVANLDTFGTPTLELTGTSGSVLSGANYSNAQIADATIWINPALVSSSTNVTVTGMTSIASYFALNEETTLKLSADGNNSVDFLLGTGSTDGFGQSTDMVGLFNRAVTYQIQDGTLVIAAGDGLSNLGTTDKLNFNVALTPTSTLPVVTNGVVQTWIVGQDKDVNQSAAFLTYVGTTGTSADPGFEAYTPTTTSFSGAGSTDTVDIQSPQTVGYTTATNQTIYTLQIDKNNITSDTGGTVSSDSGSSTTGSLTFTSTGTTVYGLTIAGNGLILNGGSLTGNELQIANYTTRNAPLSIYTSLAGGTITTPAGFLNTYNTSNGYYNGYYGYADLMGPGVLAFGAGSTFGDDNWFIQGGALDLSQVGLAPTRQAFNLEGGNLELNGANFASNTLVAALGTSTGTAANQVSFFDDGNNAYASAGGGFAARGTGGAQSGNLNIALGGTGAITTPLVWDYTYNFLQNGAVLSFGATNANSIVNFENAISLGYAGTGGTTGSANPDLYLRNIALTGATGDNLLDPFAVSDPAVLSGVISADAPFYGLATSGNGVLVLSNAGNSYTGATSIGGTSSLLINNDTDLGIAPTAAYPLNVDTISGIAGGAITPGAVVINGGATLGIYYAQGSIPGTFATTPGTVTLSPDRTILLASGADGATPSNIDVLQGTTAVFDGMIGDYVGEKGALNKNGSGTLDLGGANVYSGGTTVSAGTLNANTPVGNGNVSSTGTGSVTVLNGGTLGGIGVIQPGVATNGVILQSGAQMVSGSYSGTTVTGQLTLDNTVAKATILNAEAGSNMVFSLGAGNTGISMPGFSLVNTNSTYVNILGSTAGEVAFSLTGSIITVNDLTMGTGLQFFNNEAYMLIEADSNADYVDLFTTGGTTDGVADNGFVTNVTLEGTALADDGGLSLYLDNGKLFVVPEPGTWTLLLGGLGLLMAIRRARSRAT